MDKSHSADRKEKPSRKQRASRSKRGLVMDTDRPRAMSAHTAALIARRRGSLVAFPVQTTTGEQTQSGRHAEVIAEFAATQRYKLHRDGRFFDLDADPAEKQPLKITGETETTVALLQSALDHYKDARPPAIAKPWSKSGQLKKGKE